MRPVVAQGHKSVTVKSTGCEFDPPLEEFKYLFIIL